MRGTRHSALRGARRVPWAAQRRPFCSSDYMVRCARRVAVCIARLCAAVRSGAWLCTAVRGGARLCAAVRGGAWLCTAVRGGAWLCAVLTF